MVVMDAVTCGENSLPGIMSSQPSGLHLQEYKRESQDNEIFNKNRIFPAFKNKQKQVGSKKLISETHVTTLFTSPRVSGIFASYGCVQNTNRKDKIS